MTAVDARELMRWLRKRTKLSLSFRPLAALGPSILPGSRREARRSGKNRADIRHTSSASLPVLSLAGILN
jgi:hypothetical protein